MTTNQILAIILLLMLGVCGVLVFKLNSVTKQSSTWEQAYNASERRKDSLRAVISLSEVHIGRLDEIIDSVQSLAPIYIIKHEEITKEYEKDYNALDTAGRSYYMGFWADRLPTASQ